MNINEAVQICWWAVIRVKCMCGVFVCSVQETQNVYLCVTVRDWTMSRYIHAWRTHAYS